MLYEKKDPNGDDGQSDDGNKEGSDIDNDAQEIIVNKKKRGRKTDKKLN